MVTPHPCYTIQSKPQTFVTKAPILFYNIKNTSNVTLIHFVVVREYGRDFPLDRVWKSKVFFSVKIDELCLIDVRTA